MYSLVNLNMQVERELQLERDGMRRTRRWIGDNSQVKDLRWYRKEIRRLTAADPAQGALKPETQRQLSPAALSSKLARIFNLPNTRRQTVRSES